MNKFSVFFKKIEIKVVCFFTYISKVIVISTIALALFNSIGGVLSHSFTIQPFDVPVTLSSNGITGNFISWQLSDEIAAIQDKGWSVSGLNLSDIQNDSIEEDIVFFGISFNAVKSLIRNLLNIQDKAIRGSLVTKGNILYLKIKIYNMKSIVITSNLNDFDNVYEAYDQTIHRAAFKIINEIDPFVLASFYWANDNTKASIKVIQEMITNKKNDLDSAYLLWGEILANKNKYSQAIAKFKQSAEINPENYLAWNAWGWALYRMGDNDSNAILKFKKAVEIAPDLWHGWYHWGHLLTREQKYREAIIKFKKAILADKSKFEAYNEISYVLNAHGEIDTAIFYLHEGIKNSTYTGLLHSTLAEKYWLNNENEKAYSSLRDSLEQGFDVYKYIESEPYKTFAQLYPKPVLK
jgi:tetratricopeptide (TPR) repeat protein